MATNSFLTAKLIAERALPLLAERCAMFPLIYRGEYDGAFKKYGDTIQVRKPVNTSAIDTSGDISAALKDVKETPVDITLNNQYGVPVALSSKEQTLNVDDFTRLVTAPAVTAIAENINAAVLGLYADVPYFSGTSGATPATLASLAGPAKVLNKNKAVLDGRAAVIDFDAEAKLRELDAIVGVDKSGTNEALRQGILGQIYGMMLASDGQVKTHTAGGYTSLEDVTAAGTAGDTEVELTSDAGAATTKLEKGDLLTIDGYQYVVTAQTAAAVDGVVTAAIYPALHGTVTVGVVAFPDVTARAHVANLAFQRDAFGLAMAPLDVPLGGANAATVSYKGLSIRVIMDYAFNTDKNLIRFDVLYGTKTLFPELACRILG